MVDDVRNENESATGLIPSPLPTPAPPFLSLPEVITHLLPSVTLATLRWWVHTNYEGFNTECVTRRGGRVFVIRDNFLAWMLKGSGSKPSAEPGS